MYYYGRYRVSRGQRFMSDLRYYAKRYAPVVLSGIVDGLAGLAFLAIPLFLLPILGCMLY